MKSSDVQPFKKLLLELRAHLRGEINLLANIALDALIDDLLSSQPRACRSCRPVWRTRTAPTMKQYIESLIGAKERALALVESALKRMGNGTYGVCEHCGESLPRNRLVRIPYSSSCDSCDSQEPLDSDWTSFTKTSPFHG